MRSVLLALTVLGTALAFASTAWAALHSLGAILPLRRLRIVASSVPAASPSVTQSRLPLPSSVSQPRIALMRVRLVIGALCIVLAVPSSSAATSGSLPVFDPFGAKVVARVVLDGAINSLTTVDLNGDGYRDILLTVSKDTGIHPVPVILLVNNGRGGFSDQTESVFVGPVAQPEVASAVVVADFNGDGRPDVFLPDSGNDAPPFPGYQNTLILSSPGGHLVDATANLPAASNYSGSACASDVNHDGHVDLYVSNQVGPPQLLLNDGSGHFSLGGSLPPVLSDPFGPVYWSCALVDVNGDGSPDLVLGGQRSKPESAVLLNDGAGNFHYREGALPAMLLGPNKIGRTIASADLNHDGHPDLLISYDTAIRVLINKGNGSFRDETAKRLPAGQNRSGSDIYGIEMINLDHNGTPDFGTHLGFAGPPTFFSSNAAGVFHAVDLPVSETEWDLADLNGDGRADIAEAAPLGGLVEVNPQKRPAKPVPKCKRGQKPTKRKPCRG